MPDAGCSGAADGAAAPEPAPAGYAATMSRPVAFALGGVLVVIGLVWFLQGIDVLGGSAMSGVTLWAIVGPIVALAGVALIVGGARTAPK
jgi:hypothetical protein